MIGAQRQWEAKMGVNTAPLSDADIKLWFDSPGDVAPNTYEFALVLGGTVAAGAYTAGVIDFLIEALDAWTDAQAAGQAVPRHKAALRVITGTSGGGVNAAIAARALAYDFPHVTQATPLATAALNPFYNTWVNALTLADMLKTSDLDADGATAVSLLNGAAIDSAAKAATGFTAPSLKPRGYVAAPLRLILTLTNLSGIAYRIDFGQTTLPDGSTADLHQRYIDHADYARFAVVFPGQTLAEPRPDEFVLRFDGAAPPQAIEWPAFSQFAMGTGAFPIGFPPRPLSRPLDHYRYRVVAVPGNADPSGTKWLPLVLDWAAVQDWGGGGLPDVYSFLAVDGGTTDNEPIELARTALAGVSGRNPRAGLKANRGVVLIDPFAGSTTMEPRVNQDLPDLAQALVSAVTDQTRYATRDLLLAAYPDVFSRFMITAQRDSTLGTYALATGGLGAFIGFAHAALRRHDYLLGRNNCQDFLRNRFVLPEASPVFKDCLEGVPVDAFVVTDGAGERFLPIIPLVGAARVPEATDPWPVNALKPSDYHDAIAQRFKRLLEVGLTNSPLSSVLVWIAATAGQGPVADTVVAAMQSALKEWKLA